MQGLREGVSSLPLHIPFQQVIFFLNLIECFLGGEGGGGGGGAIFKFSYF
jgi:hypothetical protein